MLCDGQIPGTAGLSGGAEAAWGSHGVCRIHTQLCTNFTQPQGTATKLRASWSHADVFQPPIFIHSLTSLPAARQFNGSMLTQLLEGNCRLTTCAGMWAGMPSMCVGASGNMSLRKHPCSPQKGCLTTGIPSDPDSFRL